MFDKRLQSISPLEKRILGKNVHLIICCRDGARTFENNWQAKKNSNPIKYYDENRSNVRKRTLLEKNLLFQSL